MRADRYRKSDIRRESTMSNAASPHVFLLGALGCPSLSHVRLPCRLTLFFAFPSSEQPASHPLDDRLRFLSQPTFAVNMPVMNVRASTREAVSLLAAIVTDKSSYMCGQAIAMQEVPHVSSVVGSARKMRAKRASQREGVGGWALS